MAGTSSASSPDSTGAAQAGPSVWLSRLPPEPDLAALTRCLDSAERERLDTLAPQRQLEFGLSRWLIRQALAQVSGLDPDQCAPVPGRPVRSAQPGGWSLSLSHSHGVAACAISPGAAVGVDLEPLARRSAWQQVVKRWFTDAEQAWLLDSNQHQDFLRVWTLKEAWLKATGRGIAGHLQTLEVSADGRLRGDDQRHPWCACVGTLADLVLAVAYSGGPSKPSVHWLAAPELSAPSSSTPSLSTTLQQRLPPSEASVDWWTAGPIHTEACHDQQDR